VLAEKQGDNAQVEALASALPWPCQRLHVRMAEPWLVGKPRVAPSLAHLDRERSDPLEPPWPDLVITMGRRTSMVALWIRQQSVGRTRIVLLGKPSGRLECFDLVIGSAEVRLPPLPRVVPISLPLVRADPAALEEATRRWRETFAALPRPLIGLLVGGPTGPFVYDRALVRRLLELSRSVRDRGGTPYLCTSRRTPIAWLEDLVAQLPGGCPIYRWGEGSQSNPYLGLLGLADGFAVTGDSISMLVEVVRCRRPLAILPLSTGALGGLDRLRRVLVGRLFRPEARGRWGRLRRELGLALYRWGLVSHTRDFDAFHRMLVARGLAVWAGQGFPPPRGEVPDDLALAADRVRALWEECATRGPAASA